MCEILLGQREYPSYPYRKKVTYKEIRCNAASNPPFNEICTINKYDQNGKQTNWNRHKHLSAILLELAIKGEGGSNKSGCVDLK